MCLSCASLIAFPVLLGQVQIVTLLFIVVLFFLVLLILGVRRSYILKKENEEISQSADLLERSEDQKRYDNFKEGHLYDNN